MLAQRQKNSAKQKSGVALNIAFSERYLIRSKSETDRLAAIYALKDSVPQWPRGRAELEQACEVRLRDRRAAPSWPVHFDDKGGQRAEFKDVELGSTGPDRNEFFVRDRMRGGRRSAEPCSADPAIADSDTRPRKHLGNNLPTFLRSQAGQHL